MSALRQSVDDYLQVRRALGYKLTIHGRVLPQLGVSEDLCRHGRTGVS